MHPASRSASNRVLLEGLPDLVLARQSLISFGSVSFVLIMALAAASDMSVLAWALVKAN